MSTDTPRPIDRTPRQVAGPGVDDDLVSEDLPRDPHPVAADPDDVDRLRADDVEDVGDPDLAPVADAPPAHLAGADTPTDDDADEVPGPEPEGPAAGDPVAAGDPDVVDPGSEPEPVPGPDAVEPEPVAGPDAVEPEPVPGPDAVEPESVVEPDGVAPEPVPGPDGVALDRPGPDGVATSDPDSEVGPEPVGLGEPGDGTAPDPEPDAAPVPVGAPIGFMADTSALRERWESVQVGFVDDPRHAVEEAHEMVAAAVAELQAQIDRQRDELGGGWRDDGASTDALLSAFQGYRDLFDRVLSV